MTTPKTTLRAGPLPENDRCRVPSGCWNAGPSCAGCWIAGHALAGSRQAQGQASPAGPAPHRVRTDYPDVARIYLASHVLLNEEGQPFQEILNELTPEERPRYEHYLQMRGYDRMAPKDAAAARLMLLEIVDRATLELEDTAGVFRELEEINLRFAGHRLSWDDTPEGERLRRYGLTCKRTQSRMFDLLLKLRTTAGELDIATVASIRRSVPTVTNDGIDRVGAVRCPGRRRHRPRRASLRARSADRRSRSADRSQTGSGKCAERTQFPCSGDQSGTPGRRQRGPGESTRPTLDARLEDVA